MIDKSNFEISMWNTATVHDAWNSACKYKK